jgi:WD40 repeat protein
MTINYSLERNISGHCDTVNSLSFSPDGLYLASGGDDGLVLIVDAITGEEVKRFMDTSIVTAVVWHPTFPKTVISGHCSGDIHTICFEGLAVELSVFHS